MKTTSASDDFPPLETARLLLRELTPDDTDFVFRHFGDPAVTQHLLDEPPVTQREQAEKIVETYLNPTGKTYNRWGVVLKEDNTLVGTCGYHKWDKAHRRTELGYDLAQAYWGQGIMAEALREVIRHGFQRINLNRIDALVYPENARSVNLLGNWDSGRKGCCESIFT